MFSKLNPLQKALFVFVATISIITAGCADPNSSNQTAVAPAGSISSSSVQYRAGSAAVFSRLGPFAVGVTTVSLGYTDVEIWYPALANKSKGSHQDVYDLRNWIPGPIAASIPRGLLTVRTGAFRNAPAVGSTQFPLVLFVHGLDSYRDQSTFLTTWIASWGFIVAAPDFPSDDITSHLEGIIPANDSRHAPNLNASELSSGTTTGPKPSSGPIPSNVQVLTDTENMLVSLNSSKSSVMHGVMKIGPVAVIGESYGGFDALEFAHQPQVATYIMLASGTNDNGLSYASKPLLLIAGSSDANMPLGDVRTIFDSAPLPKKMVVLNSAGHLAFTDLCLIYAGRRNTEIMSNSVSHLLPGRSPSTGALLGGCSNSNLPIGTGFAIIRQFTIAQLRSVFYPGVNRVETKRAILKAFPAGSFSTSD